MFHRRDHYAADVPLEERAAMEQAERKRWLQWLHEVRNKFRPFRWKNRDTDETHHLHAAEWTGGATNGSMRRDWARKR